MYSVGSSVCQECEECYLTHCPNGWVFYKGSCYMFADNIQMDWTEATVSYKTHVLPTASTVYSDCFVVALC